MPSLLRVEDDYKRALYSLTCDVIVLKLTTDPLQAPGDISTRLDEVRQNPNPLPLFLLSPTGAPPNTFNQKLTSQKISYYSQKLEKSATAAL